MNKQLLLDIVSILNNPTSLENKQLELFNFQKRRRGNNKRLLYIVGKLLDEDILPIHFSDSIDVFCLQNTTDDIYQALKTILEKSKCLLFNSICAEILWMHFHEKSFAAKAIKSYASVLDDISPDDEMNQTRISLSICRIYSKYKTTDFAFEPFFDKMISFVSSSYDVPGFCILFILNGLSECGEKYETLNQAYENAILYCENQKKFERAISFLEGLETLLDKYKKEDKKSVLIRIAKNYENEADLLNWDDISNSHRIISLLHKAMNTWERANSPESHKERKRIAKRLIPVKKNSLKALQTIKSNPVDISDWLESVESFIEDATLEAVIYRLAEFVPLKSFKDLKASHNSSGSFFADFFQTTITDGDGRITCIIPAAGTAKGEELTAVLEHEGSKYYSMIADGFIQRYLWLCRKKFNFTEENLSFLVEDNMFIPENRKSTFLKGLVAGFNLELPTAMHLLMPQIENAIRCLAQECGAVVYKTHKDGVEECLSLESILKTPEVIDCFEETFLFNLKLFYLSEYGFGMRNIVGHGLNSDKELQSSASLATWWFTLKICCMYSSELTIRLNQQIEDRLQNKE